MESISFNSFLCYYYRGFKLPILLLFAVCGGIVATDTYANATSTATCDQEDVCSSYLDVAADMISKAKNKIRSCGNCAGNQPPKPVDCADIFEAAQSVIQSRTRRINGVHEVWPMNRITEGKPLSVYCDMITDGGGWTVIQRRGDFQRSLDYFYKDWKSYKEGFGDIEKDFWLGNDNIYALTNQKLYSARFDLKDVEQNTRYALYDKFWIENENQKYALSISDYSGDAGDAMATHNNQKFSTKDQKNDNRTDYDCAVAHKGGWWYNKCHTANLNGLYYKGRHKSYADGVNWHTWLNYHYSLEWTEIKIRPKNFRPRRGKTVKG